MIFYDFNILMLDASEIINFYILKTIHNPIRSESICLHLYALAYHNIINMVIRVQRYEKKCKYV